MSKRYLSIILGITALLCARSGFSQCPSPSPVGGGGGCPAAPGKVTIGSQSGVVYQALRQPPGGGTPVLYGAQVTGNGGTITVVNNAETGIYTVRGSRSNCTVDMLGSIEIVLLSNVGTPSQPSGVASRCQGGGTSAYTTSASNATSYTWTISPTAAGTVSGGGTTGTVTWSSSYSGTATISVRANGCGGPSPAATRSVVVSPPVNLAGNLVGSTSLCAGGAVGSWGVSFSSSTVGVTSYEWALNPPSAGTISPLGGDPTSSNATGSFSSSFSGTVTVMVRANGCGGPTAWKTQNVISVSSVGIPTVTTPSHTTQYCKGVTTTQCSATAAGATSYNWSFSPAAAGSVNSTGLITWNTSFTGFATVSATANGCSGPSAPGNFTIEILPSVGTPGTPSGAPWQCQATPTSSYSISPVSQAINYNWSISPSSAGSISGTGTTGTVTWNSTFSGMAQISVTANGCNGPSLPGTRQTEIRPTVNIGGVLSGTETICVGGTNTGSWGLSFSSATVGVTSYEWAIDPSSAGTITPLGGDPMSDRATGSFLSTGNVTVKVRANGCNGPTAWKTLPVISTPSVTTPTVNTLPFQSEYCRGTTTTQCSATATGATSYTWSISPSAAGTINSSGLVTWNSSFTGVATVSAVANGCNGPSLPGTFPITITPFVGTPSTPSGPLTRCQGPSSAADKYTTSATNATSYNWSISPVSAGTMSGTGTTGTVAWSSTFNGTATVTVTANGCGGPSLPTTRNVTVSPNVFIGGNLSGTQTLCVGSNNTGSWALSFSASTVGVTSYEWGIEPPSAGTVSPLGGDITSPNATGSLSSSFSGTATIKVRANGCGGPTPWKSYSVTSISSVAAPTVNTVPFRTNYCQGTATTQCSANSAGATSYNWSLSPPTAGGISSSGLITWNASYSGSATVTATANGCNGPSGAGTFVITIDPAPSQPTVQQPYIVPYNSTAQLSANGAGAGEGYNWYSAITGGNSLPSTSIPNVQATTTYYVTKVKTATGCESGPRIPFVVTVSSLPVANAGPDKNIQIPLRTVTLNGSGTDPDGTITSYLWTKVSGPLGTLTNPSSPNLVLTNLQGGIYVFSLEVTDNSNLKDVDEVVVTVTFPENNYNYIKQTSVEIPINIESQVQALAIGDKKVLWNYFDGLGRPMQKVEVQASPGMNDIIHPITYDPLGREDKKFLPFVPGENLGLYFQDPVGSGGYTGSPHHNFYNNGLSDKIVDDDKPFAKTVFEPSPANRIFKQGAAGDTWQPISFPDSHSQKWAYHDFLGTNVTGGGSDVELTIAGDVLTLKFIANFPSTVLKTGAIKQLTCYPPLPDMRLGSIAMGNYEVFISDNWLHVQPVTPPAVAVNTFGMTSGSSTTILTGQLNPFLQHWDYRDFLASAVSGGGSDVEVKTEGNVLTVKFNAGFPSTQLKTGRVKPVFSVRPIPDMTLGTIATGYTASIKDNYLFIESSSNPPASVTGFSVTFIKNLPFDAQFRSISMLYALNASNEVLNWRYNYQTNLPEAGTSAAPVYYAINTLNKTSTYDEHNRVVIEYSDMEGRAILKRVQAGASQSPVNDSNYASTYYVYDDFGNLVSVLPPEAVRRLSTEYHHGGATNITKDAFIKRWAFRYVFDAKRRLIQRQAPGAEWIFMVYDGRDRLVLTQDGNQRSGGNKTWMFTKYDALNRPVVTGLYNPDSVLLQDKMQKRIDRYYNQLASNSGAWWETYIGNTSVDVQGYDNKSFPVVADLEAYLTVTYYDNYLFKTFLGSMAFDFKNNEISGQETAEFGRVQNLVTGTRIRALNNATLLNTVNYYDSDYRLIQLITDNLKGHEVNTNIYDFAGKVIKTKTSLYLGPPVSWTNLVNVTVTGEMIARSASGGQSTAASVQTLPVDADGWVEATIVQNANVIIGLSSVNDPDSYTDFALSTAGASVSIYENNVSAWVNQVLPGDVIRVERVNNKIYYKRNGVVMNATPSPTSAGALQVKVSFINAGARITGVKLSNTFSTQTSPPSFSFFAKRFTYDHAGRLTKTWHQLKGQNEVLLAANYYNELGQLIDKKLYSIQPEATPEASRIFMQSVDHRYNVRGWLTSINNATLQPNAINDDTGDFFGMELAYNGDLGTGNVNTNPALDLRQYNGNISAIKWGSLRETKQAYNFKYDQMNRLLSGSHYESPTGSTWGAGQYDESGLAYDLNGNIQNLQRKGMAGAIIDNLTYFYGSGTTASNKLISVTDNVANASDKVKGFNDTYTSGTDYNYDVNGNMVMDQNKGLSANITYNHLNLPYKVIKNNATLTYFYDATGRKLGQLAVYGGLSNKLTEYVGPWYFENDQLTFVQHEEGRIVVASREMIFDSEFDNLDGITTTAGVTAINETVNGETYIKVTGASGSSLSKKGITPLGGTFTVTPGERYVFKARGYRNGQPVSLYMKGNSSDFIWAGGTLPAEAKREIDVEQVFTIPPGMTQLTIGVLWNSTDTGGDYFYLSNISLERISVLVPEYQYHLGDHLGNVRLTFTTKQETETGTATYETANINDEQNKFLRIANARRVQSTLFDRTNGAATGYAERLNGSTNEKYGIARSISVMPGDVINSEVYAKYVDNQTSNWTQTLTNLMAAITNNTGGIVVDGTGYNTSTSSFMYPNLNGTASSSGLGPKAYLNWLIFDHNFVFKSGGYARMTTAAREYGQDVAHEKLSTNITIKEPGYVYLYLSNEEPSAVEVFFDDFKVEHIKSPILQIDDYYPFGLTFNSFQRENAVENQYQYNGKERQEELDLDWLDYGARMYMPEIGRFPVPDRYSDKFSGLSPWQYSANNPVGNKDVNGDFIVSIHYQITYDILKKYGYVDEAADAGAYYGSYYADRPPNRFTKANNVIANSWGMPTVEDREGWNDDETINSQDTSSPKESARHAMEADDEHIGSHAAKKRGQEFGWSKIFEAAKAGEPGAYKKGSKAAKAFGVGIHALQDSKAHEGVKMSAHDINKDMGQGEAGLNAYYNATSITESAVLVVQMLNGNYSNIEDGTTIEISGMNKDQLYQLIDAAIKSKKTVRFKNEYKDYKK